MIEVPGGSVVGRFVSVWAVLAVWAAASPALAVDLVDDPGPKKGPAAARAIHDDASLVLLVSGEHQGRVGACGCEGRPLGGLARQQAYVEAVEATGSPSLVLHAGAWLDAGASGMELTERARVANEGFLRALRRVRVDVLNTAWPDLAALEGRGRPGLVASGLHHDDSPVLDVVTREVGGVRVAVTGMSRAGMPYLMPPGTETVPGVAGVQAALDGVERDLAVVLVYDDPEGARAVAQLPGVDVVVEAARYNGRWEPFVDGALHVRTWEQGQRLTELRLWVGEGLERAMVRQVDLDAEIGMSWLPPGPPVLPIYEPPTLGEPAESWP